jgi:kinesin family protein 18/19
LAGSERATDNKGLRLQEGANINKSLLSLSNCITQLSEGSSFVPYRDSKLTRILKECLGGNAQTLIISCISPSYISYEETANTLKYSSKASKIKK